MRVVSWNIELGRNVDGVAEILLDHPDLQSADIVLSQEMSTDSANALAERLGMHVLYDWAELHCKTGEPFGNAIMTRSPLRDPEHLRLPHIARVNGQPRSAVFAATTVDDVDVLIGSIHLETVLLSLRRRVQQLEPVSQFLAGSAGPSIIGGDFNTASRRSIAAFERTLAAADMQRLSELGEETFHRFGRPFVLDHFFGRGLRALDGGVVPTGAVSDHEPIWVELSPT